ncbi:IS3 family transposase [Cellulomonas carbonis]|uniref:IS3 family transposase n=1 Tax=Cellulomonas carbonis TaxID=1386092 RepID=UPI0013777F6E|nr:IS3 family transposase [Cellulomonas carbonis]
MSTRVSRARAVVATGRKPAVVARVARVSRQALYRPPSRRPAGAGPGRGRPGDAAIVEVARANPVDGTRMVAALASRELGVPVNRKRVQRVMRAHGLLQRSRNTDRRRRPGYFRVTRPDELWHMDMTKVWTAAHGWVYLHVIVDCCTRRVAGWTVDVRTRTTEAIGCVEAAVLAHGIVPEQLTLGTDNGSQFTSRDFRKHLSARGITHRRGGYRDPESQAFIESWFGQFKKRCAWRTEWETIEDARTAIAAYVETYHHRPHSGLGYRTPTEVARAWADPDLQTAAT